jgi:hypothetical protein
MRTIITCWKCVFYNSNVSKNCPTANSFIEFCRNNKVAGIILSCEKFKEKDKGGDSNV